jgi:DNA polymerase-3 subunit gamma/tau
MRFDFKLVSADLIEQLIEKIYGDLKKPYEKEAVAAIAAAGEGSVRDALSIADMCLSYKEGKLTYYDVQEVTGASSPELLLEICNAMLSSDLPKIFELVEDSAGKGRNFSTLNRDMALTLRNFIYIRNSGNAMKILQLPSDLYAKEKEIAEKYDTVRILTALESLVRLEGVLRYHIQPRTAFETAVIRAAVSGNELNADALARLKTLEDNLNNLSSEISSIKEKGIVTVNKNIKESISEFKPFENKKDEKPPSFKEAETDNDEPPFDIDDIKESVISVKKNEVISAPKKEMNFNLQPTEEKTVFPEVKFIDKSADAAKGIIGKVIRNFVRKSFIIYRAYSAITKLRCG